VRTLNQSTSASDAVGARPAYRRARLLGALRLSEIPGALGIERGAVKGIWTPDFVVLCALVALTILLGRVFSKVKVVPGTPIYVTEVGIAAMIVFALWRVGLRSSLERIRKVVPVVPLLLFWLAGAIAAARGLYSFGFHRVQPDIALAEYSIFVPLLAVVVDTRERIVRLFGIVFACSVVITIVYGFLFHLDGDNWFLQKDPGVAIAMYMTFAVLFVVARLVVGASLTPLELLFGGIGLVLISASTVRAALYALAAALVVVVLLAPHGRRLLGAGVACAALAVSVGGALLLEKAVPLGQPTVIAHAVSFGDRFVADDGGTDFIGGVVDRGDAATGKVSRALALGERYDLAALTDLQPGSRYTVTFAVKPLNGHTTTGIAGDPTGLRWGQALWTAAPVERWQFFRKTLTATTTSEELAVVALSGSPQVLVDAVTVVKGAVPGPSGDFVPQRAVARPGFTADDSLSAFSGGTIVLEGGAQGHAARRVELGEPLEITALKGLRRRVRYTVTFAVKPLQAMVTRGFVGDARGRGWGRRSWRTSATPTWQFFHMTLTPKASRQDLTLKAVAGSPAVLFDAISVRKAGAGGPVGPVQENPTLNPHRPKPLPPSKSDSQLPLARDLGATFGGTARGGRNVRWRLAIWRYMLEQTAHDPVFGVGFGRPTNFRWEGLTYDGRTGDPLNQQDVTGPHNSFVNLIFRTGALGFLSLLALAAVAAVRLFRALRRRRSVPLDRALLVAAASIFAAVCVIASFSVALEGPFMGMFFWIFLALALILSRPAGAPR
jgi:hypothetical protein